MAIERPNRNPYSAFNFIVEINGAQIAAFQEVSGLDGENTPIEYREGADPMNTVRKLPGIEKYPNLTCKRGITGSTALWDWRKEVRDGSTTFPPTRDVTIKLLDEKHETGSQVEAHQRLVQQTDRSVPERQGERDRHRDDGTGVRPHRSRVVHGRDRLPRAGRLPRAPSPYAEEPAVRTDVVGFIGFDPRVRNGSTASALIGSPPSGHEFRVDIAGFQIEVEAVRYVVPAQRDFVLSRGSTPAAIPIASGQSIVYGLAIGEMNGKTVILAHPGAAAPSTLEQPPTDTALRGAVAAALGILPPALKRILRLADVTIRRDALAIHVTSRPGPELAVTRCDDMRDYESRVRRGRGRRNAAQHSGARVLREWRPPVLGRDGATSGVRRHEGARSRSRGHGRRAGLEPDRSHGPRAAAPHPRRDRRGRARSPCAARGSHHDVASASPERARSLLPAVHDHSSQGRRVVERPVSRARPDILVGTRRDRARCS